MVVMYSNAWDCSVECYIIFFCTTQSHREQPPRTISCLQSQTLNFSLTAITSRNTQEHDAVDWIWSFLPYRQAPAPAPSLAYFYRHWIPSPRQVSKVGRCRSPHTFHSWVPWCCVCTRSGRAPCQACPRRHAGEGSERHARSRSRTPSLPCHR